MKVIAHLIGAKGVARVLDCTGVVSPPLLRAHCRRKTNVPLGSPLLAQGIAPHHSGLRCPNRFHPHRSLFWDAFFGLLPLVGIIGCNGVGLVEPCSEGCMLMGPVNGDLRRGIIDNAPQSALFV
jgi:hypothetical protein